MHSVLALILVVAPCLVVSAHSRGTTRQADEFDALTFLEKTGYLDDLDDKYRHHAPDNVKQALKEFQHMSDLPITGRLDSATVKQMKRPRCGVPDVIKPSQRPANWRENITDDNAPLAFKALGGKWKKSVLTYSVKSFTKDLSQIQIYKTIRKALRMWHDVTYLTFNYGEGQVDMDFEFVTGKHTMDPFAFDGPSTYGGTLGHAYGPGNGKLSGDVHFDDAEKWTVESYEGINLLSVATHEIGHALGLAHSDKSSAIMFAYYLSYSPDFHLHEDDIKGIQALYGKRLGVVQPTYKPRPTSHPQPTPNYTGETCDIKIDAITQLDDGIVYIMSGTRLYSVTHSGAERVDDIWKFFPKSPLSPGAAVYDRFSRKVYIFRQDKYWRYSISHTMFQQYSLDGGYPKTLPTIFHHIDAAIQLDDGSIQVFKGENFALWTEGQNSHFGGYPKSISSSYGNAPSRVFAAFRASNGYVYMFSGNFYWRYLSYNGTWVLAPDFPRDNRLFWLGCGRAPGLFYLEESVLSGTPGK